MHCFSTIFPLIFTIIANGRQQPDPEVWRVGNIAADICTVSEAAPMWPHKSGAIRTALAIVAIGWHESRFNADVQMCKRGHKSSVGLFQLEGPYAFGPYTREELCGSTLFQSERALAILRRYSNRPTWGSMYAGYHNGSASTVAGEEIGALYTTLLKRYKLKGT